jgi:septum formation protein
MNDRLSAVALASRSPRRKQLLETLGLAVEIVPSSYQEEQLARGDAAEIALRHALGKARSAGARTSHVLIAADTIVELEGELMGKPHDQAEARAMLGKLSGREHQVFTGFAVIDCRSGRCESGVESTRVRFRALSDTEIAAYVATDDPLDKAGAYGIQGQGALLVRSISGDFYTVVGLPLARIGASLRELGYTIFAS